MAVGHLASSSKSVQAIHAERSAALHVALQILYSSGTGRVLLTGRLNSSVSQGEFVAIQSLAEQARSTGDRIDRFGMSPAYDAAAMWLRPRQEELSELVCPSLQGLVINRPVFVYYEQAGDRTDPHFDESALLATIVVCLKRLPSSTTSALRFIYSDQIERVPLAVGDYVIFEGSKVLHGFEAIGKDENVTLLTIGLSQPKETE